MSLMDSLNLFMPTPPPKGRTNLFQTLGLPPEEAQILSMFGFDQMLFGGSAGSTGAPTGDLSQVLNLINFLGVAATMFNDQKTTTPSHTTPTGESSASSSTSSTSNSSSSSTTSSSSTDNTTTSNSTSGTTSAATTTAATTTETQQTGPQETVIGDGKITLSQSTWDAIRQDPSEANRKKLVEQAIFKATGTTNKRIAVGKLFNMTINPGHNKDRESALLFDDIVTCIAKRIDPANLSSCPSAMNIDEGFVSSSAYNPGGKTVPFSGSSASPGSGSDTPAPIGAAQQRAQDVAKMGSPLTLDLNGDGVKTSAKTIRYDIEGDGITDTISDISQGDGTLVIDSDHDGVAGENGHELLGDNTDLDGDGKKDGFKDGFDALRALANQAKQAGIINGDDILDNRELKSLEAAYGLKIKTGSLNHDAVSLSDAGVSSINLATGEKTRIKNFDGQGNDTVKQDGAVFTRADGSKGAYEDIFFQVA